MWTTDWKEARRDAQEQVALMRGSPEGLLELVSSPNGHVREAAIAVLAEQPSAAALACIIERLNDWVEPVAAAALRAFDVYLQAHRLDDVLGCFDAIVDLLRKGRVDHLPLVERVMQFVCEPAHLPQLTSRFSSFRGRTAAFVVGWLLQDAARYDEILLLNLMRRPEPSVRRRIVDAAAAGGHDKLLRRALHDRSAAVRLAALRSLAGTPGESDRRAVAALCTDFLLDASVAVRFAARCYGEAAGVDTGHFYQQQLARAHELSAQQLEILLWEGQRLGLPQAIPLARQHLQAPRTRMRLASVLLLLKLSPPDKVELVLNALRDPSAKMRRAMLALLRSSVTLDAATLEQALAEAAEYPQRTTFASVLRLFSPWRQLALLLRLYASAPAGPRLELLDQHLADWDHAHVWFALTHVPPAETAALQAVLHDAQLRQRLADHAHLVKGLQQIQVWHECA